MKKILVAQAPWNKPGYYGVRAGSRWPHFEPCSSRYMPFPFFMAYAAAMLEESGFEVMALDAVAEKLNDKQFISRVSSFDPDLLFLEISTISLAADVQITEKIREIGDFPVAWGGLHVNLGPGDISNFTDKVNFFLPGEYEFSLLNLATALKDGIQPERIEGLELIKPCNAETPRAEFQRNITKSAAHDVDSFPWPARHLFPMYQYHDCPGAIPEPSLQMWASRGCPYGCIFCAWPQIMYGSRQYRARKPASIIEEANWCVKEWGYKSIYFDDDTFNIDRDRMMSFCSEWRRNGPAVPWAIMARADLMDSELLDTMAESGMAAVKYGVESACSAILARCGKSLDISRVRSTIEYTRSLNIPYHLTFMLGLPGETKETIRETVKLAMDLDPDSLQFSIATPFPGSEFYNQALHEGWLEHDIPLSDYDGYSTAVISTRYLTASELEKCLRKANNIWENHLNKKRKSPWTHRCRKLIHSLYRLTGINRVNRETF